MHDELVARAAGLADADLLRHVARLASCERDATVELIGHLAEHDARKLHVAEGYSSLFAYCTGSIRLSEHAAYNRIEAARVSRRFPAILDLLGDGSLNLSTLRLLAPHLRPDNFESLVERARHRSKREVEALVAELAPQPDVPASVRKLPERRPVALSSEPSSHQPPRGDGIETVSVAEATLQSSTAASATHSPSSTTAASAVGPSAAARSMPHASTERRVVAPLSPGRYRMQFTMSASTHQKLRQAQELLRREIPDGDPDTIIGKALALLLEDTARRKLAATANPRLGSAADRSPDPATCRRR